MGSEETRIRPELQDLRSQEGAVVRPPGAPRALLSPNSSPERKAVLPGFERGLMLVRGPVVKRGRSGTCLRLAGPESTASSPTRGK